MGQIWLAVILMINFVSQNSLGEYRVNDCGPAIAAMIIQHYTSDQVSISDYYSEMGVTGDNFQSGGALIQWIWEHAVDMVVRDMSFEDLVKTVGYPQYQPVMVLVNNYYPLPPAPKRFPKLSIGNHWLLVIGFTREAVIVHDPMNGPYRFIPQANFQAGWQTASWHQYGIVRAEPLE